MVTGLGDYNTTETVNIPFNTFDSNDPCASVTITDLAVGDIEIHKDGNVAQRTSDNGVTLSINFDGITGNHMIHIDLSDNSDAGFYAAGSRYAVRIEGATVDGGTINVWVGAFSIGCTLRPTTDGRTLDVTANGAAGMDWANVEGQGTVVDLSATTIDLCDEVTLNSDMRGTDNAALAATALSSATWTAARAGYLDELAAANLPADIDTILTRIVGTLLAGNHTAQSGDGYAVVNHADHGNAQLVRSTTPANKLDISNTGEAGLDFDNIKDASVPKTLTNITVPDVTTLNGIANNVITNAAINNDAITATKVAADVHAECAAAVWDELLTGATHNIATSAGRRLREIAGIAIRVGTAQAGASNTITLDAGASATNSIYNRNIIAITGGTGAGQTRLVAEYYGATNLVLVDRVWYVTPDNTSEFQLLASPGYFCINCGLAQAGAAGSITLEAGASAITNAYRDCFVYISSGTGAGQTRNITAYDAGTKIASIAPNWDVNPDNTSVYHISAFARTNLGQIEGIDATDQIRDAVLNDATRIDGSAINTLSGHDPGSQIAAQSDITGLATEAKQDIIDANVDAILVDTGTTIPAQITALNDIAVADIIAGINEGALDLQEILRIILSGVANKTAGGGTPNLTSRDVADTKNRITLTVDANGNRTNSVLDGS